MDDNHQNNHRNANVVDVNENDDHFQGQNSGYCQRLSHYIDSFRFTPVLTLGNAIGHSRCCQRLSHYIDSFRFTIPARTYRNSIGQHVHEHARYYRGLPGLWDLCRCPIITIAGVMVITGLFCLLNSATKYNTINPSHQDSNNPSMFDFLEAPQKLFNQLF